MYIGRGQAGALLFMWTEGLSFVDSIYLAARPLPSTDCRYPWHPLSGTARIPRAHESRMTPQEADLV